MGFPVQGRGEGNPLPFGLKTLPFGLKPEGLKRNGVENRHPTLDHPNPEGWCDLVILYRLHYLYVSLGVYLPFFSSVFLSVFSSVFLSALPCIGLLARSPVCHFPSAFPCLFTPVFRTFSASQSPSLCSFLSSC